MNPQLFKSFFESYAKNVDQANNLAFWKLSDAIITAIIQKELPSTLGGEDVILDAGGGTARWAIMLAQIFKSNFVVYDLSEDMLLQAKRNIAEAGLHERIHLVNGSLTDMSQVADCSIDHIVSIYSPLSFIYEQDKDAKELFCILKPGGRILIMSHGYHNALASKINNYRASAEELQKLADEQMVKWAPHVPELVTHSKESIEKLFSDAGFHIQKTYGVPVFVQPGPEDFDPENEKKSAVSEYLENPDVFKSVFEIEMRFNANETVVNRGMNMFMLAEKK